jgi:hypothetical protein
LAVWSSTILGQAHFRDFFFFVLGYIQTCFRRYSVYIAIIIVSDLSNFDNVDRFRDSVWKFDVTEF